MARRLPVLLGVLMITAGCLGNPGADSSDENVTPTVGDEAPPSTPEDGEDQDAPAKQPTSKATLDAPPQWQPGEWWTIEVSSSLLGEPFTITRVVTGTEGGDYLVGLPRDDWSTKALVLHIPGLGEVRQSDLSFEAHDARFELLDFPLTPGKTWETEFEALPVDATVEAVEEGKAKLHYCCSRNVSATYDPSINAVSRMTVDDGFISYEVTDHGYGFEGVVTVPHGHDLVFNHGRLAGAVDLATTQPAAPVESVDLSSDYGRVSFVQIVGPVGLVEQPASSAYVERATNPNGTTFETQHLPTDGGQLSVAFYETTDLGGTWQFEHAAPGPGIAFTEGIAYHVFDIRLPGGHLLGDHGGHVTK